MLKPVVTAFAVTALAGTALAGCAFGGNAANSRLTQADPQADSSPPPVATTVDSLAIYLDALRGLLEGDAVSQTDAFRAIAAAVDVSPTTTNRLRYALALATPAHPSTNPGEAQRLLSELVASGDALLPEEQVLALIHLKDVEQRLILDAEAERLQRAAAAATAQRNDRTAQELSAALEENRQLKAALDEARAKLDAITNIERSIRERENGPDTQ
jgi:hypothetical protein